MKNKKTRAMCVNMDKFYNIGSRIAVAENTIEQCTIYINFT